VFADILGSNIIGASSFCLLVIYLFASKRNLQLSDINLYQIWGGFIVLAMIYCVVKYLFISALNWHFFAGTQHVLYQLIISIVAFPIFYMLLHKIFWCCKKVI
jgi:hypothetical protein